MEEGLVRNPVEEVRTESPENEEADLREDRAHSSTSHVEVVVHRRALDEGEEDHDHRTQPCNEVAWE